MAYAAHFVHEEDSCEIKESAVDFCPLCAYQNDNIITNIGKVHASLIGQIDTKEIYTVICKMYHTHVTPLRKQGKNLLDLDEMTCAEHFTRHVVNSVQQVADDILYCSKMQRHYKKNIALRNNNSGTVMLNPQSVTEYVKISKHKLELIKYFSRGRKNTDDATLTVQPYAFN